jgi:predicted HTH domain antitoxin
MDQKMQCLPSSGLISLTKLQEYLGIKNVKHMKSLLKEKGIRTFDVTSRDAHRLIKLEDLR